MRFGKQRSVNDGLENEIQGRETHGRELREKIADLRRKQQSGGEFLMDQRHRAKALSNSRSRSRSTSRSRSRSRTPPPNDYRSIPIPHAMPMTVPVYPMPGFMPAYFPPQGGAPPLSSSRATNPTPAPAESVLVVDNAVQRPRRRSSVGGRPMPWESQRPVRDLGAL